MTRTFEQKRWSERPRAAADVSLLWGHHTVHAALANPGRRPRRLRATENAMRGLEEAGLAGRITPQIVRPHEIERLIPHDAVHQGLLLEADPLDPVEIADLPVDGVVIALDQVTDPHNVGAILRSAAAFGVRAIVMTNRHSPEATGVLAKAASGALEHVPFCLVRNLARALADLGARGFLRIGLDGEAPARIEEITPRAAVVLVLGAEGRGLRASTREACDALARLDLPGAIRSLNVSNAAAVALYALRAGRAGAHASGRAQSSQ